MVSGEWCGVCCVCHVVCRYACCVSYGVRHVVSTDANVARVCMPPYLLIIMYDYLTFVYALIK